MAIKPASERIPSYESRIKRARSWQAFYKTNSANSDEGSFNYWVEVEASLQSRLAEAKLELAQTHMEQN